MIKKYEYRCVDKSLLTPFFRAYIAAPTLKLIPISIHPNLITVVSFLFSLLGLYVSYFFERSFVSNAVIAVSIFSYLLFDCLDGMQAKRRGGGSPLGEFMDHFLDVLINGIITFTLIFLFQINNPVVVILMFSSNYLVQAVVFLAQRQSGWLHFGKVESLEAVLLLSMVILLDGFDAVRNFLTIELFYNLRLIDWLFILSAISGLKVLFESYSRIKTKIWPLIFPVLTLSLIIFFGYSDNNYLTLSLLITMAAVVIIQEYLIGHLTGQNKFLFEIWPIIAFVIGILTDRIDALLLASGLFGIVIVRFIITVNTLRKYNEEEALD